MPYSLSHWCALKEVSKSHRLVSVQNVAIEKSSNDERESDEREMKCAQGTKQKHVIKFYDLNSIWKVVARTFHMLFRRVNLMCVCVRALLSR